MQDFRGKDLVLRTTILAFIIGFSIPLIFLIVDFILQDVPKTINGFFYLFKINPIHYLTLTSPVVLAVIAYFSTNPFALRQQNLMESMQNELKKTDNIKTFTDRLIADDFEAEYELAGKDDKVGHSLLELKDTLEKNKEFETQRRKEDEQRNWIAEGLAKFAEILRRDNDNMEVLSYNIISNLVKYLDANQGGFFILNDQNKDNKYFELTGIYAFERRKYANKEVQWGEGLIGSAALERQTIFLKEIPDSYLDITSGLGKANPKFLLIVPLIINEEIHGVMEIASFMNIEQYKIEFVEKVAESIASTISSVKINVRTAKLLEESREQAEIMASQEEEMRQNMEELQATQEEAARQAEKFISFTNSVNHTLIRAEYDTDGTLLYANTKFLKKLGYTSNSEVEGQHISMFINNKDKDWFFKIWNTLSQGGRHFEGYMKHMTKGGQDLWTMATYTCVRKEDGSVEKILFLAIDTTEQKKESLDYEGQIKALNRSSMKVDFDKSGLIIDHNNNFLETLKLTPNDLKEKTLSDLLEDPTENLNKNWNNIKNGVPFQGAYITKNKYNEDIWLRSFFTPMHNMYGEVERIIMISYDMTKEKIMEIESQKKNEKLKDQEEKLRQSDVVLRKKLKQARTEMQSQFNEIEKIKIRNERTLEGALDAIFTINQKGVIEFFNQASEDLWKTSKNKVLGENINILFSEKNIQENDFIARLVDPEKEKIVGKRQEVNITDKEGNDIPILILISEAKVEDDQTFTAFVQQIEIELF